MHDVRTCIAVGSDHCISGTAPRGVPIGEPGMTITVAGRMSREQAPRPRDDNALPRRNLGPGPEKLSLRREDLDGDDAR